MISVFPRLRFGVMPCVLQRSRRYPVIRAALLAKASNEPELMQIHKSSHQHGPKKGSVPACGASSCGASNQFGPAAAWKLSPISKWSMWACNLWRTFAHRYPNTTSAKASPGLLPREVRQASPWPLNWKWVSVWMALSARCACKGNLASSIAPGCVSKLLSSAMTSASKCKRAAMAPIKSSESSPESASGRTTR